VILLTMSNRRRIKTLEAQVSVPPIVHPATPLGYTPIDLDKVRSVSWQRRSSETNRKLKKVTNDDNHATITEHWSGDRQDVIIRPEPVRMGITTT
jgi:hypothetical protein